MKKLTKIIFSKVTFVSLAVILQVLLVTLVIYRFANNFFYFYILSLILSVVIVFWIINRDDNPSYKIVWIIMIMAFPIFGGFFYLMYGIKKFPKKFQEYIKYANNLILKYHDKNDEILNEIKNNDLDAYRQAYYLKNKAKFNLYNLEYAKYFDLGEKYFEQLLIELDQAKKYIFMEYFIIEEGKMWNPILEILKRKVKENVEVRLMYDDAGCLTTLKPNYHKILRSYGIKTTVFNTLNLKHIANYNNRDHRKICVIDGNVAFTGGINLADEYINAYPKLGHWKDGGIMIKGKAVNNFILMFLSIWDMYNEKSNWDLYLNHQSITNKNGYIIPFSDTPNDEEIVGENVHMHIINLAKKYVYIMTPYLIVDNEIITNLKLAAKSGVDVRIITPHVPDKWYVHLATRAYYGILLDAGVRIYEYEPGFIHAKNYVSDDKVAVIGTTNMDYRSYYLHHECGVWIYDNHVVDDLKQDFLKTQERCVEITKNYNFNFKRGQKIVQSIIRLFAPLM